ncbi:MAG: hypothetical protein RL346_2005 [Verrucomicrobiota bacterium]|jgi:hypothetical protein
MANQSSSFGIGLGTIIAVIISWSTNHSILWAVIHGILSWFYVIYYALGGGRH